MTKLLRFDVPGQHATGYDEFGTHPMPEGATSELMLRYILDGDGVTVLDQYAGLTDEEAVAEHVRLQEETKAAAEAEAAQAAAVADRTMTQLEFLRLFTLGERIALREAAATDPVVDDFLDLLDKASAVWLDDPDTSAGLDYMAVNNYLTAERVAEIKAHGLV